MISIENVDTILTRYNEVLSDILETYVLKKEHLQLLKLNRRSSFENLINKRAESEEDIKQLKRIINTLRSRRTYLKKKYVNKN